MLSAGTIVVGRASASSSIAVWQDYKLLGIVSALPGTSRTPFDINSHGRYVGVYSGIDSTGNYVYGGFAGMGLDAQVLSWPGIPQPRALGINDHDTIAGMYLHDGETRVGYYASGDTVTTLLPLPGEVESPVWAINNNGDMVGLSTRSLNGYETATVYLAGSTTPIDMNALLAEPLADGYRLVRGIDINNHGQILVEGDGPMGYRYYVLTPIPEPALGAVLGGVWLLRRRSRVASGQPGKFNLRTI